MPKASKFNQVVSMDLKDIEKGRKWILHIVDEATRYTAASIIDTKKAEVVVKSVIKIWIAYFGRPDKFHSDCGGEFTNDVFRELHNKFGIETSSTPAEAPYNNGVVERGNKVLYESMIKTKNDVKCDDETALAWAVSAKNCLQNVYGFSPNQLVLSQNVNLPSVIDDKPPALESHTSSDLIRTNLNALHSARKNFIEAESSEKIRRALSKNIRSYSEVHYQAGDRVYYRRNSKKGCNGPAKVLGKDGNFVLVRQGAAYYRCHPCDLMKEEQESKMKLDNKEQRQHKIVSPNVKSSMNQQEKVVIDNFDSSDEDDHNDTGEQLDVTEQEDAEQFDVTEHENGEQTVEFSTETENIEADEQEPEVVAEPVVIEEDNENQLSTASASESNDSGLVQPPVNNDLLNSSTRPKRNTVH